MSRRIIGSVCVLAGLLAFSSPAMAKSHLVVQRTSPKGSGYVTLFQALVPGHQYRVDVKSDGKHAFKGAAIERYNAIANHQFFEGSKPVQLNGFTPKSFTIKQPLKVKMAGWQIGISLTDFSAHRVTVKVYDLGIPKKKKK